MYQPPNVYESIPRPGCAYQDFQQGNEKTATFTDDPTKTQIPHTQHQHATLNGRRTHTFRSMDEKNSHTHSYSRERGTPRYEGRPGSEKGVPHDTRADRVRKMGYPTPTRTERSREWGTPPRRGLVKHVFFCLSLRRNAFAVPPVWFSRTRRRNFGSSCTPFRSSARHSVVQQHRV